MSLFLLRLGELTLKKGSRPAFEHKLKDNIKKRLKGKIEHFEMHSGRYYVTVADHDDKQCAHVLATTFGIVDAHRCLRATKDYPAISYAVLAEAERLSYWGKSFKINAKRTDKSFPLTSYELASQLGAAILSAFPYLKVDVKEPDFSINIEIRQQSFIYGEHHNYQRGAGGLPAGTGGRGLLLLSGGIDSPVAGWMMAKRGLFLSAIHFYTPPYTSDDALLKAKKLAIKIAPWNIGFIDFYAINFTAIQLKINSIAQKEYATLMGRACMMQIAHLVGQKIGVSALITGEALSQVASQTLKSLFFTNAMAETLVLRPCIGMDKDEIITIARRIDAFDTATKGDVDCCSLFAPVHPIIHPHYDETLAIFEQGNFTALIEQAVNSATPERLVES